MMVSPVRPSKKHYDSSSSSSSYGSFSSSDSDVSASSVRASMERPVASIEVIRCLRCARCVEMTTTDDASMYGMIRVGTGIYYCDRLESISNPSFSFGTSAPPPSWCPTTHLVRNPSAEGFRPVRVEWKDSMVRSLRPVPQIRPRAPRPVSSTSTMEIPMRRPPRIHHQLLMLIGALRCFFADLGHTNTLLPRLSGGSLRIRFA
ncbi:hypothetical protein LA080_001048 [Diaporthe eres]|nr:hypothetical protein LA080_001048 [Diaporthe eres]